MKRKLTAAWFALAVLTSPCPLLADDTGTVSGDKGTDMLVDAVLLRPLGLVTTVLGTAVTVVTLPFTLPSGSVGDAADAMIMKPAEYTFNRPLGDFHHCGADRHPCGAGN